MQQVAAGMYRVVLTVNGQELPQSVRVEVDTLAAPNLTTEDEDDEEEQERETKAPRIDH
jgi:hypothetical protein